MKILNLTPHPVNVIDFEGKVQTIFPEPEPARIASQMEPTESVNGVAMYQRVGEFPVAVPEPQEGTLLIVSSVVKLWFKGDRDDLIVPAYYDKARGACRGFWK